MFLVVDVGNTNITCGVYKDKKLLGTFRLMTKQAHTSDEYGIMLCGMLNRMKVDESELSGAIIASVVPNVMHAVTGALRRYLNVKPLIVGPGIKTGIRVDIPNPREMGADRIVDAVAAYELYGGPVLVLDFGTATTYDLVMEDGSLCVGITAPGIRISAKALWEDTAKLPEVELVMPKTIMAKDTITSMQAGLMFGQIGQTEYIINRVKQESGLPNLKVIATGGLGRLISNETQTIDKYDDSLTLEGLRILYEKNR